MIQITNPKRFITLVLTVVAAVGLAGWLAVGGAAVKKSDNFEIKSGQGLKAVIASLEEDEFIARTWPWRYQAWRQKAASKIQAGVYRLERGERASEVIARFAAGDVSPAELTITYPEGFTIRQMAERTAAKGIGTADDFMAVTKNPSAYAGEFSFLEGLPPGRTLEGYLFPDTYRVFADDTPIDVVKRMLANFQNRIIQGGIYPPDKGGAGGLNASRTLDEVIIMASIIEREVIRDDDMAMASGVLWKRYDDGAGLGADATTRYILDKWDGALTVADLDIDSPYNTRRYRGLPPGAISNPGLRAITAALQPQESEFYYYLSAPTGETIFSKTNDEHNRNKAKYLR